LLSFNNKYFLQFRQCERPDYPDFRVSRKTKQICFLNRIWTRKQTVLPYSQNFCETNVEVNAKLELWNHCTKIIEYFEYFGNDKNRPIGRHQSAAINRPFFKPKNIRFLIKLLVVIKFLIKFLILITFLIKKRPFFN